MRQNRDNFSVFFNMKLYCVFLLEWSHRGNSNEYTQYIIFNIKQKTSLTNSKSTAIGFSKGGKNEFETATVNKLSVFEPLKVYCNFYYFSLWTHNTAMYLYYLALNCLY